MATFLYLYNSKFNQSDSIFAFLGSILENKLKAIHSWLHGFYALSLREIVDHAP